MKFTWKVVGLTILLLAFSLSAGGYLVIRTSFDARLETEITAAQEDMELFSMAVQAICLPEISDIPESLMQPVLRSVLQGQRQLQSYPFRLSDAAGRTVFQSGTLPEKLQLPTADGEMETRICAGNEYLLTTERLALRGQVFFLERSREISGVFAEAEGNLHRYQLIMLGVLAFGTTAGTGITLYLMRPIHRISRAARVFSTGNYERRVNVQSGDELGQLAQDFNAMADALEAQIHALADAAERQKEFTASFAHELKTPLTSVIGYADTLRSRVLPPKRQFEAANYIFTEGKRLEAMSFALLDLFALEREAPALQPVSITRIAQETKQSCEYLLKQKRITLLLQVQEAQVPAVPELLKTLLYNLIDNARKASAGGSAILFQGEQRPEGYRVTILDRGRGIPPEALGRITEAFYMVDKSRSRAEGGAGLGLALCRKIAELHGTSLQFESEEGKGTRVWFVLGGAPE